MRLMSAPTEEFNIAGVLNPVYDPLLCLDVLGIVVTLTGERIDVRLSCRLSNQHSFCNGAFHCRCCRFLSGLLVW
jgi:hypothetical protein